MAKVAAPSGFRDFLPAQFRRRQELVRRIREAYESFGFEGMDTPAMESARVLVGTGGGENEKLMFHVLKRGAELERALAAGGRELSDAALRFDLTVPLARYYASHRGELPSVFKRYQIGPVWRAERPQHGRFREFIQCDVDVLGSSSMAVEAEVILATTTVLARLGFADLTVRLNSRPVLARLVRSAGVAEAQVGAAVIAIDKLDKEPREAVSAELVAKGVPAAVATELLGLYELSRTQSSADVFAEVGRRVGRDAEPLLDDLREIVALTPSLPAARLVFDPFLARGMDYYTGPIFEIAGAGVPFSLAGGGRFDGLVERLAGVKVPACGFSIGFERVFMLMEERGMFEGDGAAADVLVVLASAAATGEAIRLGAELRATGLRVDVFPHAAKVAAQFELADRKRIAIAVVVDPERLAGGEVEVRVLATRQSSRVARADVARWIAERAGASGHRA
jgi:histidyl-tRNA synthetase